jgi:threonine/homoserine/homoserine lactone efflux protein
VIPIGGFLAVTLPLILTPGASTAVVLRHSLGGGARAGLATAAGVNAGSCCYGLLSAFGFAIALRRWPMAWTVLRVAGAGYLAWLGAHSLWRATFPVTQALPGITRGPCSGVRRNFWQGLATNALNPAIATFYLVLLPQFIPRGAPVVQSALLLTAIHIALAFFFHVVWAFAGARLARALAAGRARRSLDALTGAALVALAVRIAVR